MKKSLIYALAFLGLMTSCKDETTLFSETQDDISIETSTQTLENSIVYDNAGVLDIMNENSLSGKSSLSAKDKLAGDYPLTLVARVSVPYNSGLENLTASHIFIDGGFCLCFL